MIKPATELPIRDGFGRFAKLVCVNAHDRCYGGAGGPCPYCELSSQALSLAKGEGKS